MRHTASFSAPDANPAERGIPLGPLEDDNRRVRRLRRLRDPIRHLGPRGLFILAWFELALGVSFVGVAGRGLADADYMNGLLWLFMGINFLADSLDWARRGRLLRKVRPGEVSHEARWWFLPQANKTDARPLGQSVLIALGAFTAAMWAPGNRTLDGLLAALAGIAVFVVVEARRGKRPPQAT